MDPSSGEGDDGVEVHSEVVRAVVHERQVVDQRGLGLRGLIIQAWLVGELENQETVVRMRRRRRAQDGPEPR